MHEELTVEEGSNLAGMFFMSFVIALVVVFGLYFLVDFEAALLAAICLLIATVAVIGTGIENVLIGGVRNQIARLRGEVQGYLTDMYAEMIGEGVKKGQDK